MMYMYKEECGENYIMRSSIICISSANIIWANQIEDEVGGKCSTHGRDEERTRAVCKVHGLTLLLRVGTLWRCGDGLFFEVPPLASDALLTTFQPLHENVLQTVEHFGISCLGPPFSWLEKPRNHMGRDLNRILCSTWKKRISGTPLEHPPYSPDLAPSDFWAFPTMKRELRGKKFRSGQRSAARFPEVGGVL
jgi:hypothetical protein